MTCLFCDDISTNLPKKKLTVTIEEHSACFRNKCTCGLGTNLSKFYSHLDSVQQVREDLKDWSPDLFQLFSYLGDKQQDSSKKEGAEELLTILFHKTLHNGYFGKLPFGGRDKFTKMTNTTLPLVVLMWLCQLQ